MPTLKEYPRSTRDGTEKKYVTMHLEVAFIESIKEMQVRHRETFGYQPTPGAIMQVNTLRADATVRKRYNELKGEEENVKRKQRKYLDGAKGTQAAPRNQPTPEDIARVIHEAADSRRT